MSVEETRAAVVQPAHVAGEENSNASANGVSRASTDLGYVPALDGMRGIAVLAVMVGHALGLGGGAYFQGGSVGVDIFFVLSGFLITYLLVREHDRSDGRMDFRNFYVRRALRLGPALLGMLLAVTLGGWLLFTPERAQSTAVDALITLFYAANWARAFDIHPPDLLGHAWSLSIEEQFYALWPILLFALLRNVRSRFRVVVAIGTGALLCWALRVVLLISGTPINRLYNGLDTRGDCLLIGCALGVVIASGVIDDRAKRVIASWLRWIAPVSAAVFLYVLVFGHWAAPNMYYWLFVVIEVLAAATILQVFVAPTSATRVLLSARPLVWIGSISYGLYLWHFPIYRLFGEYGVSFEQKLPHVRVVLATLLTFGVATASYYLMEKPILRLKRGHFGPAREARSSTRS